MTDRDRERSPARSYRLRSDSPVVVGVDGSREAERGMLFAADLAVTLRRRLVVVHALGLYDHFGASATVARAPHEVDARRRIESEWCVALDDMANLRWTYRIVHGSAVDGILRVADDVDAGFIVIGSHGAGVSDQPLLGSTSQWVVRNSHRPVVIVPPGDNHPHRRPGSGAGAMNSVVADC